MLAAMLTLVIAPLPAIADCLSDCSMRYERAMDACRASQPAPAPDDAPPGTEPPGASGTPDETQLDALQPCMDRAQADFGACSDRCQPGSSAMPEMP
jgi:hypothetical protein